MKTLVEKKTPVLAYFFPHPPFSPFCIFTYPLNVAVRNDTAFMTF